MKNYLVTYKMSDGLRGCITYLAKAISDVRRAFCKEFVDEEAWIVKIEIL